MRVMDPQLYARLGHFYGYLIEELGSPDLRLEELWFGECSRLFHFEHFFRLNFDRVGQAQVCVGAEVLLQCGDVRALRELAAVQAQKLKSYRDDLEESDREHA